MTQNSDFEAFFAEHHGPVVRALTLALGDRGRAEDAAQVAFAQAFRQWRKVAMMDRPVAWVYVVALRGGRRARRRELAAPAPELVPQTADPAGAVASGVDVRAALTRLAPRQRLAVVLRYLADLQVSEVASAMGCSTGTAKATLHTALSRMRVDLTPADLTPTDLTPNGATTTVEVRPLPGQSHHAGHPRPPGDPGSTGRPRPSTGASVPYPTPPAGPGKTARERSRP